MRHLEFKPTHRYKDVFNYGPGFDHQGSRPFVGSWDKKLYYDFLNEKIAPNNISEIEWPYYNIESDFYSWNSLGYRTHEFDDTLKDYNFDMALGCSFVEGIGVRINERWDYFYENYFNTKMINLGKGGSSVSTMSYIAHGWFLANRPKPKRVILLWTEPSRDTYVVDNSTPLNFIPTYKMPEHTDLNVATYTEIYKISSVNEAFWSNKFVQMYNETNLLFKCLGLKSYNFLLDDLWPKYNLELLNSFLCTPIKPIRFNVPCPWSLYYPAADGSHPGKPGHINAFETIKQRIEHEEN